MGDVKRSELVKAAKTLNDLLGIKPAIKETAKVPELKKKLTKAATFLTPADVLPDEIKTVLIAIGALQGEGEPTAESGKSEPPTIELVQGTKKLADMKAIVAGNPETFPEINADDFKGLAGVKELKKAMLIALGADPETITSKPAAKPKEKKPTKKAVVVEFLKRDGGATLEEMGKEMTARGIDPDTERNTKTAGLWIRKIGFKVVKDKETGKYSAAEEGK